jgi:hypothetical protein
VLKNGFDQAEGYRYLTRILRAGLESFLECNDTNAPVLAALANGLREGPIKLGSDNPDNLYQNANLDSRETYLLKGDRGQAQYLGFGSQAGTYGQAGGLATVMYIDYADLKELNPDGSFEIILSGTRPAKGNWLELRDPSKGGPTQAMLIVRQTFRNRLVEVPAKLTIKRISGPHEPSHLTCSKVEESLQTIALFVCGATMMFSRWSLGFQKHPNTLPLFDQEASNKAGGDPQIRYYHSYWELKCPDDCLMIESLPLDCEYWNFQLNNHWMESLDYRYFTVHVNKWTANYHPTTGQVRVIVAHKNPEEHCSEEVLKKIRPYNWIDTCNHKQGQMSWRWVKIKVPEDKVPKTIKSSVVKFGVF